MNDRLKFRVFNLETKTMIDNPDFLSFDYDCDFVRIRDPKLSINEIFNLKYDKIIIDQCTGLKDNNGKLIFEGDIVKAKGRHGTIISEVKYFSDFTMFALKQVPHYYTDRIIDRPIGSSGSSTPYRPYNWNSYFSFEVIGNIHENPELLGGN